MYKVVKNDKISNNIFHMVIEDNGKCKNYIPGQFVIVMSNMDSERIPLTIYDYDAYLNQIHLIYQVVGASTLELSRITDNIFSLVGPLGNPSEICMSPEKYKDKKVLYIAGGVGIAPVYPQIKHLKEQGFDIDLIYGVKSKDFIIIDDKIKSVCRNIYYTSDDGSIGFKGNVVDYLKKIKDNYNYIVCIGPVIMMKNVSEYTKELGIKTIVSMNPIMVDGTGMCGACRCKVDGKTKFACIDGPEFDGAYIDFDIALKRMNIYIEEEKEAMNRMLGE
ncbi:MAG: sulfide/dihydroorotate dehydrogenase-like FAD/NAD-binding protein [Bacilli bacterium]|nr:sulfide/dihydroorotate dehydrogenase-like FAD/NAD-binding protein [Bacilli bacterium]